MENQAVLEEEQLGTSAEFGAGEEVADQVADLPDGEDEGSEEVEITLGEESLTSKEDENSAPDWVRELRQKHRETQKRNRELEMMLQESKAKKVEDKPLGNKPTLDAFDYDSEKYEAALGEWYDKKRQADEADRQRQAAIQQQEQSYQERLNEYENGKKSLGVKDYDDAESVAIENLSLEQQQLILQATDNPALTVYAIGKNTKRAKELAAIKDPVKFVSAVAKLEGQLKVNKRKAQTRPEEPLIASGKKTASDSTLKRLEAEADKTGDRTKVAAYKRQMRLKAKS